VRRLLYSLAFNACVLRRLWTACQQASTHSVTGSVVLLGSRISGGVDCTIGMTDCLSSMSVLMGVESDFGAADVGATVKWPGAVVAARLRPLPNCSFVFMKLCNMDPSALSSDAHDHSA